MTQPPSAEPDTPPTPAIEMLLQAIRYAATYTDHISMPENAEALRWLASHLPGMMRAQSKVADGVCGRCGKTRAEHFGKIVRGARVHDWCYDFHNGMNMNEDDRWAAFVPSPPRVEPET